MCLFRGLGFYCVGLLLWVVWVCYGVVMYASSRTGLCLGVAYFGLVCCG